VTDQVRERLAFWRGSVAAVHRELAEAANGGGPAAPSRQTLQAMVALAGLVYAIQEATKPDPMPLAIVLALLTAAAGCWMFVRRQRRQTYPLIDCSATGACSPG
jgi:MFS transporter, DHA2 family, multidrug resistance protein